MYINTSLKDNKMQGESSSREPSLPVRDKRIPWSITRKTWNIGNVGYGGVKWQTSRHLLLFFVPRWVCSYHRRCLLLIYVSTCLKLGWSYFASRYKMGCDDYRSDGLDRGGGSRRVSKGYTRCNLRSCINWTVSTEPQSRMNKCERVGIDSLELEPVVV